MSGASAQEAFEVSLRGASNIGEDALAAKLLAEVKGLDDRSITNAIKLTRFDVYYRAGLGYKPVSEIKPDQATIQNVRTMVERSLHFLEVYGPKLLDGFTFEGGYTDTVSKGDGDLTTADTLWDFKVSKAKVKKVHPAITHVLADGPAFGSSGISKHQVFRYLQSPSESSLSHCRH